MHQAEDENADCLRRRRTRKNFASLVFALLPGVASQSDAYGSDARMMSAILLPGKSAGTQSGKGPHLSACDAHPDARQHSEILFLKSIYKIGIRCKKNAALF